MQLKTLSYRKTTGWQSEIPAGMNSPRTLVLAFGASELADDPAPFNDLAAAFPDAVLLGCSTSGEIAGTQVHDASISVAVARFEHTALRHAVVEVQGPADSWQAGARLGRAAAGRGPARGVRAQRRPGRQRHAAARRADAEPARRRGHFRRAGRRRQPLHAHLGAGRRQAGAAAHLRRGLLRPAPARRHGCDGGWSDFGPERRITRSEGNVLYELDGKPALDLYKTYLGDRAAGLPGTALLFPLSLRREGGSGEPVVRTILGIDEAAPLDDLCRRHAARRHGPADARQQ